MVVRGRRERRVVIVGTARVGVVVAHVAMAVMVVGFLRWVAVLVVAGLVSLTLLISWVWGVVRMGRHIVAMAIKMRLLLLIGLLSWMMVSWLILPLLLMREVVGRGIGLMVAVFVGHGVMVVMQLPLLLMMRDWVVVVIVAVD